MTGERKSLVGDLTDALHLGGGQSAEPSRSERLAELQREHRVLCSKRRLLHESIDLLAGLDAVKPDAAARLERYRENERRVSRQRADIYRRIRELQGEQSVQSGQN